jgi:cell division protein FtsW
VVLGLGALYLCANIKYSSWEKWAIPFLGITAILLILVLIPGIGVSALGASRRINLGLFGVQPAEIAKLSLAVFLSASLSRDNSVMRFIVPLLGITGLIIVEPDLGTTTIVTAMAFAIYFTSGAPLLYFASFVGAGGLLGLVLTLFSDYRRERLMTFLNPHNDIINNSDASHYHVRQILIALGSGGFWGLGLGQSRQKYLFLPEPATDSIFAIIAEEMGFLGAVALIAALVFLIVRGFLIAFRTEDPFGRLLAVGIISWIAMQCVVNLSAMVALVPLTGVPLPFVSYGGSSLVVSLAAMGILLNISRHARKP